MSVQRWGQRRITMSPGSDGIGSVVQGADDAGGVQLADRVGEAEPQARLTGTGSPRRRRRQVQIRSLKVPSGWGDHQGRDLGGPVLPSRASRRRSA